ncbi:MAG: hypothetical protein RLO01_13045 [Thalassobaculaceae bacterium]
MDLAPLDEAKTLTNARFTATIGLIVLIPPARRYGGPEAFYVMAPFAH